MEVLNNADIFYEMQYKEVKIVANVSVVKHVVLFSLMSTQYTINKDSHPHSLQLRLQQPLF